MRVPILKQGDYLIASIQSALSDEDLLQLQDDLAAQVGKFRSRGAIVDVIVDLRPESPTYLEHVAVELDEDSQRALYVPERFAHGYQVLIDNTHTSYQVGEFYAPQHEGGLKFDDPRLGLKWPLPVASISPKDAQWEPLSDVEPEVRQRMSLVPSGATT